MDVWTGDILTLVSMPAFDPDTFSDGISHSEWNALMEDEKNPLINKTVQGLYPPGSTFKPITAMAALEYGIDPESTVHCPGGYYLGRHRFACWRRGGHGTVNLDKSMFQSCNVYYYTRGREVGIERIASMAKRFGFGHEYPSLSTAGAARGPRADSRVEKETIRRRMEDRRNAEHCDWTGLHADLTVAARNHVRTYRIGTIC